MKSNIIEIDERSLKIDGVPIHGLIDCKVDHASDRNTVSLSITILAQALRLIIDGRAKPHEGQ